MLTSFLYETLTPSLHSVGASVRAAHATNRHILALESDLQLFEEVLKPLEASPTTTNVIDLSSTSYTQDEDEEALPDEPLISLCE